MPKKILIVEDERPIANALALKFSHSGFQATAVHNGQEALDTLKKEPFDVMLLDLMMPKLDGFGVLEALQQETKKPLVIVTSNLSQEEDAKRAKALGAKDYLVKSNTPLAQIVEHVIKLTS
jgi:DNA-binding response OmpR family regulator